MTDKRDSTGSIEPTFQSLLSSIYSAVLYNLGEVKIKGLEDTPSVNIDIAEFNMGLLTMLQDKTKDNVTNEEANLIENLISSAQLVMNKYTKEHNDA